MSRPRTILDYIGSGTKKVDVGRFLEFVGLCSRVADTSVRAFFGLYELVEKSSDKKLRREAQRLYGKTVVELAATLHKLNEIEKQLSR